VLAVPAVLGFMHMLRERRVLFGHLGGGLALIGLLAITGSVAFQLAAWQMAAAGADQAEMAALYERLHETTGLWIPFYVVPFAFYAGVVILAAGLTLARAVHPVIAACTAAGAVLMAAGYPMANEILFIAGAAVLWLGVGATGWMVLGETDEQWEHTPQVSGFRPVGALTQVEPRAPAGRRRHAFRPRRYLATAVSACLYRCARAPEGRSVGR
jgi:hypothetical protein